MRWCSRKAMSASASACSARAAARWIFVGSHSATTSEVYCIPADQPARCIALDRAAHPRARVSTWTTAAICSTSSPTTAGATSAWSPRRSADPRPQNWTEVIPHRDDVMLEDVELFARHSVVHERAGGFPRLRVVSFETGEAHPVEFPEPAYSVLRHRQRRVRHRHLSLRLRIAGHARFGVRLRHEHARPQAAQAGRGAGRLRSRRATIRS